MSDNKPPIPSPSDEEMELDSDEEADKIIAQLAEEMKLEEKESEVEVTGGQGQMTPKGRMVDELDLPEVPGDFLSQVK